MIVTIFRNRLNRNIRRNTIRTPKRFVNWLPRCRDLSGRRASWPKMVNAYQLLSLRQKKRIKPGGNILAIEWLKNSDEANSTPNTACKSARWNATTAIRSLRAPSRD